MPDCIFQDLRSRPQRTSCACPGSTRRRNRLHHPRSPTRHRQSCSPSHAHTKSCSMAFTVQGSQSLVHSTKPAFSSRSLKSAPVTARRTVTQRASSNSQPNWLLSEPNRLWEIGSRYWYVVAPAFPQAVDCPEVQTCFSCTLQAPF